MSTRQAEDVLRHTFRQLEKMLKEVEGQKTVFRPEGKNAGRRVKGGPGKKRK